MTAINCEHPEMLDIANSVKLKAGWSDSMKIKMY